MGLNDTYASVRSQILLMNPVPMVTKAYSFETRRASKDLMMKKVIGLGKERDGLYYLDPSPIASASTSVMTITNTMDS
ncbi:hypothetical protein ACH5RR_029946 [Cinchona calisaya]|uniref:Uncharacterized protein n=1 Tax=Cinchona calisaya TaxID=153742 RepID=A0ABD2YT50_9GENT